MGSQYCQFCRILDDYQSGQDKEKIVIQEDREFFAFRDHDPAAKQHVLVCTKEHLETALDVNPVEKLKRMRQFGLGVLQKLSSSPIKDIDNQTRFFFHLPPHISVYHVHLHCFQLPFANVDKQKRIFGYLGRTIEQVWAIQKSRL